MAEWTYALASVAELKAYATLTGTELDAVLADILKRTSETIEAFLGRHIVSRSTIVGGAITVGALTEYHTPSSMHPAALYLGQYPIRAITSVDEGYWDGAGTWTSSSSLTANVDCIADAERGTLTRLSGSGEGSWPCGFERVRVVYAGGYADTASVQGTIKDVAIGVAMRKLSQTQRSRDYAASSISDGMGSVTRFLPGDLLDLDRAALLQFSRFRCTGRAA